MHVPRDARSGRWWHSSAPAGLKESSRSVHDGHHETLLGCSRRRTSRSHTLRICKGGEIEMQGIEGTAQTRGHSVDRQPTLVRTAAATGARVNETRTRRKGKRKQRTGRRRRRHAHATRYHRGGRHHHTRRPHRRAREHGTTRHTSTTRRHHTGRRGGRHRDRSCALLLQPVAHATPAPTPPAAAALYRPYEREPAPYRARRAGKGS